LALDNTLNLRDLGVSGFLGNNIKKGALGGFVKLVEEGKIPRGSYLVIENIDRLSRDQVGDALTLFIRILSGGITIVTLNPEREYTTASINDLGTLIVPLIDFSRAYEESKRKSDLISHVWIDRRRKAREMGTRTTTVCPGWCRPREAGGFEPIPERAVAVRLIFDLAIQGKGAPAVAQKLNDDGVPPFNKRPWHVSAIQRIWNSRSVLGEYQPHRMLDKRKVDDGPPISGYYPRVIDDETYDRVQAILRSRNRQTSAGRPATIPNIFKGLLYDAPTKFPMHLMYSVNRDRVTVHYRLVPSRNHTGSASVRGSYRYDHLEGAFLRFCRDELRPEDFSPESSGTRYEISALSGRLLELDDKIAKLQNQIVVAVNPDVFGGPLDRLASQKKEVQARLEECRSLVLDHHAETHRALLGYAERLDTATDPHEMREAIRAQVRQLVREIWMFSYDKEGIRRAYVEVFFHNGMMRTISTGYPLGRNKPDGPIRELSLFDEQQEQGKNDGAPWDLRSFQEYLAAYRRGFKGRGPEEDGPEEEVAEEDIEE
jgi:DNA invertase Pin-like site-specific DNA recombinase